MQVVKFMPETITKESAQLLDILEHHPLPAIDLKLTRMVELLARLGHPHCALPPVIHVAGTNGKGSTIATMKAILEAHGKKVHVYTSPHLVQFHERIVVAGQQISESMLVDVLHEIITITKDYPVTYFEATTAAAFLAFARVKADFLLLETGLGGRLDATNVVDKPALTVITPVSMDHEKFLGDSVAKIAYEKAGILKYHVPCVVAKQDPAGLKSIAEQAEIKQVPLVMEGKAWQVTRDGMEMSYRSPTLQVKAVCPALKGVHQYENTAVAIAAMDQLAKQGLLKVSASKVKKGIGMVRWPARLQQLTHGVLPRLLYNDMELWLDGGHNEGAAMMLADWLKQRTRPIHLIMGMMQGRDPKVILRHVLPHVATVYAVTIPYQHDPMPASDIAGAVEAFQRQAKAVRSVEDAVRDIVVSNAPAQDILICGSLYLAGSVLEKNS